MRTSLLIPLLLALADPASALLLTDFGPLGQGGDVHGQFFQLGSAGRVHELDAFLHVGPGAGTTAQLSSGVQGVLLDFAPAFTADLYGTGGVLLTYDFTNASGFANPITFLSFLDAEIAEPGNTFFNEYATVSGAVSAGQSWEVDEPGFTTGDIFDHLLAGTLDGTNARPEGSPDDVSLALSFAIGPLSAGQIARIQILISDAGEALDGVVLTHRDPLNATAITYSGRASIVPEPGTASLLALGLAAFACRARARRR